jgi:arsenite methyltransferase
VIAGISLHDLETDPKSCCARLYESDAVRWLLDDQLHPGGERLTLQLARLAGVAPGARVVDVACGNGATARLLARELGCVTVGVDLGARAIERARAATPAGARTSFRVGDAEALPLPDGSFDVALSECSLCTFPDKPRAIAEMARVVRPGGTIAIADVTADLDALPAELRTAAARVACVADARSADAYAALLREAGCEPLTIEPHEAELRAMADRVEARLRVARMLVPPGDQRERIVEAAALARQAIDAIARGSLGYALITARARGTQEACASTLTIVPPGSSTKKRRTPQGSSVRG